MSPTNQPLPAPPAASTTQKSHGDIKRLLALWCDLALRAAQAAAHDDTQELTLTEAQMRVEQAITDRHPELWGVMNELLVWESTLAHVGDGPLATCLHCRRARHGFPDNLPFSSLRAGVR